MLVRGLQLDADVAGKRFDANQNRESDIISNMMAVSLCICHHSAI